MLKEVIRFVDVYDKDGTTINKKNDSEKKFVIIKTNKNSISYNGIEILSDGGSIKKWIDENEYYKDVLNDIEKYIPNPKDNNKAIGSASGLLTYCFFAFKLSEKNLKNLEKKIPKTKFGNDERYRDYESDVADVHTVLRDAIKDLTKISNDKYDFLGYYALVATDKKRLERWIKITHDFIKERTSGGNKSLSIEGRCYVCNKQGIMTNPSFCTKYDASKIFLKHITKYSKDKKGLPLRACGICVPKLNRFESILEDNKIKIFPLFIIPNELREQVKLTKDNLEEKENRFNHIFNQLIKREKKKLFDFYLVVDSHDGYFFLDYITNYQWNIGEWKDFYDKDKNHEITRQGLELKLAYIINEKGFIQYFGNIKGADNQQKAIIYSFRQKIFDYVYRNQNNLTFTDLQNIILFRIEKTIINGYKPNTEIFNLFFNRGLLLSEKPKSNLLESVRNASLEDFTINNNEEWAYFAGQTAYYLVSLSESSNKTVALLEPFINKSTTPLVKETIRQLVDQYKHKIRLNDKRFKRLINNVLDYNVNESFIKLKIPFYIGAFDDSLMYKKGDKKNE